MFFNLLENNNEKALLMKLAYLMAVSHSHSEQNSDNIVLDFCISTQGQTKDKLSDNFMVNMSEFSILKSYVSEMNGNIENKESTPMGSLLGLTFSLLSDVTIPLLCRRSQSEERKIYDETLKVTVPGYYLIPPFCDDEDDADAEEQDEESLFSISFNNIDMSANFYSDSSIYDVAIESSDMLAMLSAAHKQVFSSQLSKDEVRRRTLDLALTAVLASHAETLSMKSKKIILFELTLMAYADDSFDADEKRLLSSLFSHLKVDMALQDSFAEIILEYIDISERALRCVSA